MPLLKGNSKKTVSSNVSELINKYKTSGSIGTSKPKSVSKARRQAIAISLSKAGKSFKDKIMGRV